MPKPLKPVGTDHEPDGRFAPGNQAAKGNPLNRRAQELRKLLLERVTDADFGEVVDKLVTLAKAGDLPAIKELLDRLLGKPASALELTGPDGEPLGLSLTVLQGVVLDALRDHPEARLAVAAKLRTLTADGRDDAAGTGS